MSSHHIKVNYKYRRHIKYQFNLNIQFIIFNTMKRKADEFRYIISSLFQMLNLSFFISDKKQKKKSRSFQTNSIR